MRPNRREMKWAKGFTLMEMLVSMVVLIMIMIVTFSVLSQTSKLWQSSSGRLNSFDAATAGFDLLTRQISQATLNTYWDYDKDANGNYIYDKYVRASDLHFLLGSGTAMVQTAPGFMGTATTQAIFFQAPLGYTATRGQTPDYSPLVGILNTVGFYVAYTSQTNLPSFLNIVPTQRFRLYEFLEPGEQLRVYDPLSSNPQDWFQANLGTASRKIADNVIGLILRARYPNSTSSSGYTDTYLYDSQDTSNTLTLNQLPPIILVTMIVINEDSAKRLGTAYQNIGQPAGTFTDATLYPTDLQNWENLLSNFTPKLTYHVYSAEIAIRGAKWSSN